jgi:hypothetical protein
LAVAALFAALAAAAMRAALAAALRAAFAFAIAIALPALRFLDCRCCTTGLLARAAGAAAALVRGFFTVRRACACAVSASNFLFAMRFARLLVAIVRRCTLYFGFFHTGPHWP